MWIYRSINRTKSITVRLRISGLLSRWSRMDYRMSAMISILITSAATPVMLHLRRHYWTPAIFFLIVNAREPSIMILRKRERELFNITFSKLIKVNTFNWFFHNLFYTHTNCVYIKNRKKNKKYRNGANLFVTFLE